MLPAFAALPRSPFRMLDRDSPEVLFLEHVDWIARVAFIACAKHDIRGAEAEDFASWVRMKLIEDDYAVLGKFRGDSGVRTYIAVVVARYFVSYVRMQRGEWRSSAVAERLGAPARELERLVRRDGYTLPQAGEVLRTAGRTTLSDLELARLLDLLPTRSPLRPVELHADVVLNATVGDSRADERIVTAEWETGRAGVMSALDRAIGELEPEEQLIVRLYFGEGLSVADVARTMGLEQKPLYRRLPRLRDRLRTMLERAGLRNDDVRNLFFEPDPP